MHVLYFKYADMLRAFCCLGKQTVGTLITHDPAGCRGRGEGGCLITVNFK